MPASPQERLILALDGCDGEEALTLAERIPGLCWVKVGLELFISTGPGIVTQLRNRGLRVFLDLKFHDIPATMAGACRRAAVLGAGLLTVHASAGMEAMAMAQQAADEATTAVGLPSPLLLGVTVLTSWRPQPFRQQLAIANPLPAHVEHLAQLAAQAGLRGCVCAPRDAAQLHRHQPAMALVTPGIRLHPVQGDDQARTMTPMEAMAAGATWLVVGRPVTQAVDPGLVFAQFCRQVAAAPPPQASTGASASSLPGQPGRLG
ncbi:orotidine-5'-phosphate decarboxylase [Candidatus Synechococcus spongiarum]|uniref:orotidine-5'-phosphate decarboxylase n=1 Tax=Candidatus Synechococcus spongiarum TaxID=431041 RepID=UPI0027D35136|nr:orotidine-5'-phosphate decarboxylase [Candidatus Synechococcus spongiarum]